MQDKPNLIILSGTRKAALFGTRNPDNKALVPIHGKPMLDWVVEAFRASECVNKIVVVGPEELDKLECMRFVDKRIDGTPGLVRNVMRGISYVRWTWYRNSLSHPGYIISFCDAAFVTPEAIKDTLSHIRARNHDLVLHYVEKTSFDDKGLDVSRTWISVDDKRYTGASIYYIKKFSDAFHGLHLIGDLQRNRKNPESLLGVMGLKGRTLNQIEQALSARMGRDIGLYISTFPELGVDIDTPADLELAHSYLPNPWAHYNKIMVVMNGNAGSGYQLPPLLRKILKLQGKDKATSAETIEAIVKAFSSCGIKPELVWTQHPGHARELAKQAATDGYDVVVAVGGDGTINEVVNGLVMSDTALGIIPTGTANLLSSELGIPTDIKVACKIIARGKTRKIDTASVNNIHFTIMAGIGFDAHVVSQVDSKTKGTWGALAYPLVALRELLRYPFRKIRVHTDDGTELEAFFVFVQNTRLYASGYPLSPKSKIDDGTLEVLLFPKRSIFSLLMFLLGKNKSRHCVEMEGVHSLHIKSNHAIQIDGDYACRSPATIVIAPRSLNVLSDIQELK